jgi:TRAP-type C4-dicarboxylate transport system permease small subunit
MSTTSADNRTGVDTRAAAEGEALAPENAPRARSLPTRVMDAAATGTLVLAGAAIVGMACVEGWQVFARYVLNRSPSWTEPVALLLMTTAMMLGAALGVRAQRHFGFFMLVESARPSVRRALQAFANAIAAIMGVLLAGWGGEMAIDSWGYAAPGTPLPQGAAHLPLCLGGLLIALFALERIFTRDSDPGSH